MRVMSQFARSESQSVEGESISAMIWWLVFVRYILYIKLPVEINHDHFQFVIVSLPIAFGRSYLLKHFDRGCDNFRVAADSCVIKFSD